MKIFKYKNLIVNLEDVSYINIVSITNAQVQITFSMKNGQRVAAETMPKKEAEKILDTIYEEMTMGE